MISNMLRKLKHPFIMAAVMVLIFLMPGCSYPTMQDGTSSWVALKVTDDLVGRMSGEAWLDWIEKLSGAEAVEIDGEMTTIETRYDYAMFTGQENARAFEYVQEQVTAMVGADQVEVDPYQYTDAERTYTWKNLIVTLPGETKPEEVVILSAHLDSIVVRRGDPLVRAPGANDNGTGLATALEAVRYLRDYKFARTIKVIFFTAEELGLEGSRAYVRDHATENIVGVINLDMFGYDGDGDRCFEIHAGTLPASQAIGVLVADNIGTYDLGLNYDFLTATATDRSDHASFWSQGVPAVLLVENFFEDDQPGGCQGLDGNPVYHKPEDTVDRVNVGYAFDIARVSLASLSDLAEPLGFRSLERFLRLLVAQFWEQF